MSSEEMTDRIVDVLREGIRSAIEANDAQLFRRAAMEAYRIRTGGRALTEDDAIMNHVFPSDVAQTVELGLRVREENAEKASVIMKGALDNVLKRLSAVPSEHYSSEEDGVRGAGGGGRPWWRFWGSDTP